MSLTLVVPALLMGVFGGAHCVAMCGGVSSVLCAGAPRTRGHAVAYNAGRIAAYATLGLVVGAVGALGHGPVLDFVRFGLRSLAAAIMLAVGLHLVGLPTIVRSLEAVGGPLWRRIAPHARRLLPLRTAWQALLVGGLWAFMPCGLLYGALALAASASSPLAGAATMAAFGIGTLPVMLAVGLLAGRAARFMSRPRARVAAGVVVLGFGLWTSAGLAGQVDLGATGHACCPRR